ncbi:MAG TPA: hypothetical protein H9925_07500 [Candidatus Phocaeicola gallinarum]|uniref:Uncharacterized protein n=2 Tax=Bacteroidaceae TaxID=815 RepID=A0ABS2FBF4_9BACE|nr:MULTISPECIES: hypothetical protein [Bacteroidaceae]MBD8001795.1 hypothetical protein [Phocaeicola faecium]MBM6807378.1 hypothetical protein [Bacteroides caecicola]HJC96280.1 hypothetical protein [Candidatus Phocaeicola gallinarum]
MRLEWLEKHLTGRWKNSTHRTWHFYGKRWVTLPLAYGNATRSVLHCQLEPQNRLSD